MPGSMHSLKSNMFKDQSKGVNNKSYCTKNNMFDNYMTLNL